MNREVVISSAVRTPVGKFCGSLMGYDLGELGSLVIKEAINRAKINPADVDEVIMGCVLQAGLKQNIARTASRLSGIPIERPATTINMICGSGLKSVAMGASLIKAGDADVVVCGGMEIMSNAPFLLKQARTGYRMGNGELVDSMISDGLTDSLLDIHMGVTAENIAEKYGISREEQDAFAAWSQQKCEKAQAENRFADEIVPVEIKTKKSTFIFDKDEQPRQGVTSESISHLKCAFKKHGTVTAGNASGINDGAACIILMSREKALELNANIMASIVSYATVGVDPAYMGLGPIASTRKALEKASLTIDDIDLIEANEAFASQSIQVARELGFENSDKLNVNGGAIALGHPIGASGARILTTLLYEMKKRESRLGLATLCVGGGMGVSVIVKNEK